MENNIWQIDEGIYRVHITDLDAYAKVKDFLNSNENNWYKKDGVIFAYDITVSENKLKEVKKILKEFGS